MKVWVSKYALSEGIVEEEVEPSKDSGLVRRAPPNQWSRLHPGDYHTSRQDAVTKAGFMRLARITSLKKQLAKMEKLSFGERAPAPDTKEGT